MIRFTLALCVFRLALLGQQPAPSNVRESQTPLVNPDGSIHFTLKAPDAKSVQVAGGDGLGKGPFPLSKGADGIWSVTTAPAVPGFHYYWFIVDGVQMNDPGSETYFGYNRETSGIEVPETGVHFYDIQEVPHGEVRMHWYFSKSTSKWRRSFVYTPPGYDKDAATRYPVLILQHGSGENETSWIKQGRANFILDNLLAGGHASPMIVVMDLGYANKAASAGDYSGFESVIVNDLIPAIDASYRTIADRRHRAMAGLSMGGSQTLFIALRHLDLFSYIGSFSGRVSGGDPEFHLKTAYNGVFADSAAFNSKVKLLWFGAGTEEKQLRDNLKSASETLRQSGINAAFYESPGTAHEWQTWRRDLQEFAPRLFK